jgi:release factor glutamine methyltransferase
MTGENGRPALADRRDPDRVYQPAEDSRLLAETALGHVESGGLVLDIGTGSGYVGRRLAEESGATVVATDLNPHACRQARGADLAVFRANLLEPLGDGVADVVVFNPPYLPTSPDDAWGDWMERALSGGADGRAVVEPFLGDLRRVLAPDGEAFLLVSSLTGVGAVREEARANGLTSVVVASEAHSFEKLVVLHLRPSRPG